MPLLANSKDADSENDLSAVRIRGIPQDKETHTPLQFDFFSGNLKHADPFGRTDKASEPG
jgi:hypothetical protein